MSPFLKLGTSFEEGQLGDTGWLRGHLCVPGSIPCGSFSSRRAQAHRGEIAELDRAVRSPVTERKGRENSRGFSKVVS